MSIGLKTGFYLYDDANTETDKFALLGEVQELSGIDMKADTQDNTSYGPDESNYRKYVKGMRDGGEISLAVRYRTGNAMADKLIAAFHSDDEKSIRLKFPAALGMKFEANVLVTGLGIPTTKDQQTDLKLTLKVTGEPTLGASA